MTVSRYPQLGHRRKRVAMSPPFLLQLMSEGNEIHTRCIQGVPADATFVMDGYDVTRGLFFCVFEHPSWDVVPLGQELPLLQVMYQAVEA